jgi:hypothetical protein
VLKRIALLMIAVVAMAFVPTTTAAQVCLGLPSHATHPVNLGVGIDFAENAKTYGGRVGFGTSTAFAGVSAGLNDYDDTDEGSTSLAVDGGLTFPVGVTRRASVCPVASIGYEFGPQTDTPLGEFELGTLSLTGGVAFGGTAYSTQGLQILPSAAAHLAYARITAELAGESESESETFGVLDLNLGFLFSNRFVVRPGIAIPFGLEGADPVFGLSFVIGFGRQ